MLFRSILTVLNPKAASRWKSAAETQEPQCACSIDVAVAVSTCWPRVYSSITVLGRLSKNEGTINGSSTSHPPMLTPLTFSLPPKSHPRLDRLTRGELKMGHEFSTEVLDTTRLTYPTVRPAVARARRDETNILGERARLRVNERRW